MLFFSPAISDHLNRPFARLDQLLRGAMAVVLVWGGVTKLIAPDAFGMVVWRLSGRAISPPAAVSLGLILAACELALALALLFGARLKLWLGASVCLLVGFIAVLVRLMTIPDAPSCGCLSIPGLRAHPYEHAAGIVRNLALIWIAWIAWRSMETEHEAQPSEQPA